MKLSGTNILEVIQSTDPDIRNRSLESLCDGASQDHLLDMTEELQRFWRENDNLYERVRALFMLSSIYRFHLAPLLADAPHTYVPVEGHRHLLKRRFIESIDAFLETQEREGISDNLASALSDACRQLALQFLADQVQLSVRSVRGNQWMFRTGHPSEHPLKIRLELLEKNSTGCYPILLEQTPVRMDLSHSCWSDIFFLGMDYPAGAKVINVSVNLSLQDDARGPKPPVEAYLRVIETPIIRLSSVDLGATAEVHTLDEMFNFSMDYLGLLKAGLIASGIVPAGMEGSQESLQEVLRKLVGPGRGLELVTSVNNIPKGSRLAVSTNLLAAMISVGMRATDQTESLTHGLTEAERRLVAARAIQGEWLGGSGGGWQDSGGAWPGIKIICGCEATEDDPEFGISRGTLLPKHTLLKDEVPETARQRLQDSLVLVHGGMAQNVGPILEMVTEKYLLRGEKEWAARQESLRLFDGIVSDLKAGDIQAMAQKTTEHFFGPLQTMIPWISNAYTEKLIARAREEFGEGFWGFLMLGGMAGGGMGFFFAPEIKAKAQIRFAEILQATKDEFARGLPFAMDPVVYQFAINEQGTWGSAETSLMPASYYRMMLPRLIREDASSMSATRQAELAAVQIEAQSNPDFANLRAQLFEAVLPAAADPDTEKSDLSSALEAQGFDHIEHEEIRQQLRAGRIGLAQNRLPASTVIDDVDSGYLNSSEADKAAHLALGEAALREGQVAVITLAAGAASRWTEGAGVVKALHPFCKFAERHRCFLDVHIAKSRQTGNRFGRFPTHIFTTSYLTEAPIQSHLESVQAGYAGNLCVSTGSSIGLRFVPEKRDLQFAYEQATRHQLDERAQLMREHGHHAITGWAEAAGESSDYTENEISQCLHPVGHWYEFPNLLLNGTLASLLDAQPELTTLLMHNIDTVGATLDPVILGEHLATKNALTFEVIQRRIEDVGGGLAKVNGATRLVEGMALPNEEDELRLKYYNTLTNWIAIDPMLASFGLGREDLHNDAKVVDAVRSVAARMPTIITLKEVKKRWGNGQEDVYPVTQFERLWGDMSAYAGMQVGFKTVNRLRGQQLKQQAQLDGWVEEQGWAAVNEVTDFG